MPFYTCIFPRDVAGRSVTVKDAAGATVASGTLGQPDSRGMVAYTFEVEAGTDASEYTGTATTVGGAIIQARGLLNVTSTLAGEGGSGTPPNLSGEDAALEANIAQPFVGSWEFDETYGELFTLTQEGGVWKGFPAGYYRIRVQAELTTPDAEWRARVSVVTGDGSSEIGYTTVYPVSNALAQNVDAVVHLPLSGPEDSLLISGNAVCVDDTVDPTALELSYAYVSITRVLEG